MVLDAADSQATNFRDALAQLCEIYWYPLYAFVRRRGYDPARAEDLLQGFFTRLLDKSDLKMADPSRGRFRAFLLTALKNYIANQHDYERALKRGGGAVVMPLDFDNGEQRYSFEPVDDRTPEEVYERRWALTHLENTLGLLREEMSGQGQADRFDTLQGYLTGSSREPSYQEAAATLGLSEGAVRVAVHRMRKRFGGLLRQEVGRTLAQPTDVDGEIRHLLEVVGK